MLATEHQNQRTGHIDRRGHLVGARLGSNNRESATAQLTHRRLKTARTTDDRMLKHSRRALRCRIRQGSRVSPLQQYGIDTKCNSTPDDGPKIARVLDRSRDKNQARRSGLTQRGQNILELRVLLCGADREHPLMARARSELVEPQFGHDLVRKAKAADFLE